MKPAQIFHQYIWIINTFRAYRKLTLEELNQKWIDDGVADGKMNWTALRENGDGTTFTATFAMTKVVE